METEESREASLRDEIARLRAALHDAEHEATIDPLTGCLNRRGWTKHVEAEERRCRRHGLDAVVVVIDLDGLKATNDEHGHDAGDRRLVECARAIGAATRTEDFSARLGGDEFAVLAVQTTGDAPSAVVPRIRRAFKTADVRASLGWGLRSREGSLAGALMAADRSMLAAKRPRLRRTG